MTKAEAHKVMAGPLRFGDAKQIEAAEWLRLFAQSKDLDAPCHNCNGTGTCSCNDCEADHDCGICHGTGEFELNERQGYSLKQLRELVKEMEEAEA